MKFTLGFSPCPNDTFIFDALINRKIDSEGIEFDVVLEDVQTLNNWAIEGRLDFSKISYGVLPLLTEHYTVLRSGGALGKGVGPLLITASENISAADLIRENNVEVAIPGKHTTAHFLLSQAFPLIHQKQFLRFDEIEHYTLQHPSSLGVIIHENRFTYQQKGLHKIADLGTMWESSTGFPIPLGGIVGRKKIEPGLLHKVDALIKKSVAYAFEHYPELSSYVKCHAQEMSEEVMRQHIELYVNSFSIDMGDEGEQAILKLMHTMAPGKQANILQAHSTQLQ